MNRINELVVGLVIVAGSVACSSDAGGGDTTVNGGSSTASPPQDVTVDLASFAFTPADVAVAAGGTVTWVNRDVAIHSIEERHDDARPTSADLAEGDATSLTYDTPGTYPYVCGIHNYMTGAVVVS